jgi:ribose/xylose/arabinose/galactoside ABC-type transport system permease subunit
VHQTVAAQESQTAPPTPPRLGPRPAFKVLGIFILLIAVSGLTGAFSPSFASEGNVENLLYRTAMFSILGIGVAFVIITGGIDLSLGSVVALIGCLLPMLTAMSYRAIDQALVLEAYTGENKVAVLGDFTRSIKAGDTIYLSSDVGKASMIVQNARFEPSYTYEYGGGIKKEATIIEVAAPMTFDAYSGFISRNFKVAGVEAPAAGSTEARAARKTLIIEGLQPPPAAKDLLRVVKANGTGAMELPVVDSSSEGGNLAKVVVRDRDNQLTADYAFATVRPHQQIMTIPKALTFLLALSAAIGLSHGLLITRLKLQPFVVTLCGLLIYRGVIRFITNEQSQGFGSGSRS